MRSRFLLPLLALSVLLSGCAGFDAGRALRFGVDLLGAACEFLAPDEKDPEWLLYGCRYAPAAGVLLEDQISGEGDAPPVVRVRVHKADRQAFERANPPRARAAR